MAVMYCTLFFHFLCLAFNKKKTSSTTVKSPSKLVSLIVKGEEKSLLKFKVECFFGGIVSGFGESLEPSALFLLKMCVPSFMQLHPCIHPIRSACNCKMTTCSADEPCGTSADLGAVIALAPAAHTPDNRMEWSPGPTADLIPLPLVLCSTISKRGLNMNVSREEAWPSVRSCI